jgi:hypothetical protein
MKPVTAQDEYYLPARRIAGSRTDKLDQIDAAIQELIDIKALECASDRPNVRFIAVPRRTHAMGMIVTLVALLVMLVWLLTMHP